MAKNPAPSDEQANPAGPGKNRPTPSRAESVAGRRRPLVPDTKEAKKAARAQMQVKRDQARAGMAAGDEKYLPARDKGPQRRFVRDFIDSGWFVAEFIMPAMVVVILLSFISVPAIQFYSFVVLWGFILLVVIEMFVTSWRTKRAVRRRFGETKLERGTGWYAAMRSLQMRFLRLPKPQVRRGTKLS
ncbi:DUF3043 domain-containing protein [Microbacterium sp. LRZ72]|uniref:DUF3043 domain-containing protein n=1 Tax=Microbacterium sp. LRZ72 TaxID=2942481 RepID=UPI0029BBBA7F|nr:DUF3043 domain-containing protein [Microbacterium sp. LRZ72]MDX2377188.1 DUF3043 domain-containing protein [Microbacterium sp. LRZ72]